MLDGKPFHYTMNKHGKMLKEMKLIRQVKDLVAQNHYKPPGEPQKKNGIDVYPAVKWHFH